MEVIENHLFKNNNSSSQLSPLKNYYQFGGNIPSNDLQGFPGRKQIIKSFSQDEFVWRPTLKIVSPKAHSPKIIRRKLIDTPLPPIPMPVRKKQTLEAPFLDRKEYNYHTKIVKNDYGDRVNNYYSNDFHVESQMGRKQRVQELMEKRNHISYAASGDKPYKKPEQSSGFFLLDGLVAGVDYKAPISFRFLKNLPNKYNGAGIYTSLMKTLSKEKLNKP